MSFLPSPRRPLRLLSASMVAGCAVLILLFSPAVAAPPEVFLSREGQSLLPILVEESASAEVRELAGALSDGLKRITHGDFPVKRYESGMVGIIVGTSQEWQDALAVRSDLPESHTREDYLIRTTSDGSLRIIGRTPLGLQNALWEFFHKVGHRHYFPSEHWEVWPENPTLSVAMDEERGPSFFFRMLTVGVSTATWRENHLAIEEWKKRNHLISGFKLETGHIYQDIVRKHPEHFRAHPGDVFEHHKLNADSPSALDLVRQYALNDLRRNPWKDSVSMDPSDGGGWPENSPLGSPSNQTIVLANHVAREIQEDFPGRKVGIYAYNQHSAPPDIEVDPNVIVSIATSFILDGRTVDELIEGWRGKGAALGIRDYLSVYSWDRDQPGQSAASNIAKLADDLRSYYERGIRYWRSEGSTAWGPHGLGYYIASRLLWDIREEPSALVEEFYTTAFGSAAPEMRLFFEEYLSGERKPLISSDLIGRMYRTLQSALAKSGSPEVTRRIEDFVIYTGYLEKLIAFREAEGERGMAAYEDLARFSYRVKNRNVINSYAVFRNLPLRDSRLSELPRPSAEDHPFKDRSQVDHSELLDLVEQGIARHPVADFKVVGFSTNLVPGAIPQERSPSVAPVRIRGGNEFYLFASAKQTDFELTVRGGLIYGNRGPVRLRLYASGNVLVSEPVFEKEVPADKQEHTVSFTTPYHGLHRLEISDGRDLTEINWPPGQMLTLPMTRDAKVNLYGTHTFGFYVPPGTKVVAGYSASSKGSIQLPGGTTVFRFSDLKEAGYFSVDVPIEAEGKWWKISFNGETLLLTVPPYLARNPHEFLMPEEVH